MGDSDDNVKQAVSVDIGDDGIAATHPLEIDFPRRVATAQPDDEKHNTIKDLLIVVGCCTVPDHHFDFDSSFVRPDAKGAMIKLAQLREDLTEPPDPNAMPDPNAPGGPAGRPPPLSVFGHADPVGNDDYNSELSRRRASAIYGMLVRDASLWEFLFDHGFGGDQWGKKQVVTMQETLGQTPSTTGVLNKADRKALILAYMDVVCVKVDKDQKEVPFVLDKKNDFLARGKDPHAKGDVQGCSEFNPTLILSEDKMKDFEKRNDKEGRNAANEKNRRVISFLFKPGSQIDPKVWPCPHVRDGNAVAVCKERFWSDHLRRRKADKSKDREFKKTGDTFACRFYHGIAQMSPCEGVHKVWVLRILLDSPKPGEALKPLANRRFVVTAGNAPNAPRIRGRTDDDGILRIPVFDEHTTMELKLEVGQLLLPQELQAGGANARLSPEQNAKDEAHFVTYFLDAGALRDVDTGALPDAADGNEENKKLAVKQRLFNLGYGLNKFEDWTEDTFKLAVAQFQKREQLARTDGVVDDETRAKLKTEHEVSEQEDEAPAPASSASSSAA